MGLFSSKEAPSKKNVEKWIKKTAQNDKDHGRDSKENPNNKPKKGW